MLKEHIENNELILGTMISEFAVPNLLRIFKLGGYRYVIIDGEHGPVTSSQLSDMICLGRAIGLPVIVRIPGIDRGFITRTLDMGAEGFLVPMVNTEEDARQLVKYAKYAPAGHRGLSLTRSHTDYNPPKLDEYMAAANRRTILMTQIETREAVENAGKIAAVPGVDVLIIGPSDLSSDLGKPGDLKNPELLEAVRIVAEAALSHGKKCGTVSNNMEYLQACREQGMNLFCAGSELGMLIKAAKTNVAEFYRNIR